MWKRVGKQENQASSDAVERMPNTRSKSTQRMEKQSWQAIAFVRVRKESLCSRKVGRTILATLTTRTSTKLCKNGAKALDSTEIYGDYDRKNIFALPIDKQTQRRARHVPVEEGRDVGGSVGGSACRPRS